MWDAVSGIWASTFEAKSKVSKIIVQCSYSLSLSFQSYNVNYISNCVTTVHDVDLYPAGVSGKGFLAPGNGKGN